MDMIASFREAYGPTLISMPPHAQIALAQMWASAWTRSGLFYGVPVEALARDLIEVIKLMNLKELPPEWR